MNPSKKRALITGIGGQDGSYMAELLLEKGYEVHGFTRDIPHQNRPINLQNIAHLIAENSILLHRGDITDSDCVTSLIRELQPDEIYHFAGITVSRIDFLCEEEVFEHCQYAVFHLLRAVKQYSPSSRFFFAASATMFGNDPLAPQDEQTPFRPATPYAIAKSAAFYLVKMYREAHGLFAVSGILFSHESPRRGLAFVTRKITTTAARIKLGLERELVLGDLDAERDWSFAGDYVRAFWLMLNTEKPDDYVIGSGSKHTVREFVERAFRVLDMDYLKYVKVDTSFSGSGAISLLSNPKKIRQGLGWRPNVSFDALVQMMVRADYERFARSLTKNS